MFVYLPYSKVETERERCIVQFNIRREREGGGGGIEREGGGEREKEGERDGRW